MAIDVAALETALPAAIVAAVAGAPGGITVAATHVYVHRKKRDAGVSPEAWLRPLDPVPVEGGLGHLRREFPYELTIEKLDATAVETHGWREALAAYFHGFARPFTTGVWKCRVEDLDSDLHDGEGPVIAVRMRLSFEEV